MIRGIRSKLVGTYLIMIIITVALTNVLAYTALKEHYLQERQEAYLIHANVISTYAGEYIGNNYFNLPSVILDYGERAEARILVLDSDGVVINDSFSERWIIGRKLSHYEVRAALKGETAAGTYHLQPDEWVMYVTVPVTMHKKVIGAIFLSTDIGDIKEALSAVRRRMAMFSVLGSVLALAVGMWLADKLTEPVQDLTSAVQRVAQGNFSQPVPVRSSDELGQLAESFNSMATRLDQVDRTRREFIADASHELKSPLSSIKALAESLIYSDERDVAVYKEYLQDINEEIDRLNRLVHDLLRLARVEDEAWTIERRELAVKDIIDDILQLVSSRAKTKNITIQADTQGDLIWPINEDMLAVILLNLIDNGIKYTPVGGMVTISGYVEDDMLVLQVADNGEGIPEEDLPNIFERFYRVDKARSRDTGGTGLGLSIVYQGVRVLGGTITVSSTLGQGTTFNIKLPYSKQPLI